MQIQVIQGDALAIRADVLVLKHAQALYGIDELVVQRCESAGTSILQQLPAPGGFRLFDSQGQLGARAILFVGVVDLLAFDYEAIREFARRALVSLAGAKPDASHVAFTLHGAGFGLDESEAFRAELAGLIDAVESRDCPPGLELITIVERDEGRTRRLQSLLAEIQPVLEPKRLDARAEPTVQPESLRSAGVRSQAKPHVFVAMPFAAEFDDHFHYGIQQAVNASGYLCERADLATFTGDVIIWVKDRIASARLLIADLSTANPNVYLEVGYAWGLNIPTVLLARDATDLKFDVKGQRCLVYGSIRKLEELLTRELALLK